MGSIRPGSWVRFRDENGIERTGTVLEYTRAADGTGRLEYRIECGGAIYGRAADEVSGRRPGSPRDTNAAAY